jgi:single-stranded-DNA-specific exonuclease
MLSKRWLVAPPAPPEVLNNYRGINPVLAQVLYNRGFEDAQAAYRFLYVKEHTTGEPFQMKGMNKAVSRIRQAIKNGETIVVYGDFDADGVTSTTLLVQVLRSLGATVRPYIPHRVDEGYGLNSLALRKLAKAGVTLVITVDCGIRAVAEVTDGKQAGLDMIVTDHHSVGPDIEQLNEVAYAVINPKQADCTYPEDMLAGVGVAFKLGEALLKAARANGRSGQPTLMPEHLLDLVAIGTVADLMPLNHLENRVLVRQGLETLNRAQRPGILALLNVAGIQRGSVTASSIGFGLGPRINAAGRLDDAKVAYNLLSSPNMAEAQRWADKLQELNTKRQDLTRAAQAVIHEYLEDSQKTDVPMIIASDPSFQPGIVGLVAGRVAEEFFRPAIVMEQGETESRGSCRSIPQFDITNALDQCADLLVRHGGHALAAGFTVLNENIDALKSKLLQIAENALQGQDLRPTLDIDAELDVHQLSEALVGEFSLLEPTGHDNPQPVFMTRNVRVLEHRTVGKDSKHLKLRIARAGQPPLDAIGFGLGEWATQMPGRLDVAYHLEINEWNDRQYLQMNLQDVRAAED